jgi:ATP-binding cassette subfamily F protein uup
MDKMVDHLFVFEGAGIVRDFPGNYTEYRDKKESEEKLENKKEAAYENNTPPVVVISNDFVAENNTAPKRKLSFKEKFEFEELEKSIAQLETEKSLLTEKLNTLTNHQEIIECSKAIELASSQLDEKSFRWMELSEGII